jgi:hypothetical protein
MAGTIVANTLNTDTVGGVFTTNNAVTGIAKAWVSFNGTLATINSAFNVSSITRSSAGVYVINFSTALANGSYASVFGVGGAERIYYASGILTTSCTVTTENVALSTVDTSNVSAVFLAS